MTDNVNHPAHYETGKFECIEVMLETQGVEAVLNFCQCNAFKYLYRAKRKNGLEKVEGIDTTRGWYTSLTTKLSDLSDKENIRMYIMKDFTDGTDTLRQLKAKRSETLREIEKNYTNVIANVESMKNAKTAVEYLEKLGFDLSALIEADNHPVTTALTVEVDTKFLFIGGEKK